MVGVIKLHSFDRRSKVCPTFHCIVHVRLSELEDLPAPFLNRFEKYRLRVFDVLSLRLEESILLKKLVEKSKSNVQAFSVQITPENLAGFSINKTIESFYLNFISRVDLEWVSNNQDFFSPKSFVDYLIGFVNSSLKIKVTYEGVKSITDLALKCFCFEESECLKQLLSKSVLENPANMIISLKEMLAGKSNSAISRITENIIEMIITREGIYTILSLATPEAIFSKR